MTQTNDPPLISSVELIPDANEKADLDGPSGTGGKLVIGQAPNITITETTVVADAAERLALDVQEGDIAIQTNVSSSFIFTGGDNVAPNWQVVDFDAVGAIAGETISPANVNISGSINGADTSAAAAGEALTSDGSGSLAFSQLSSGSQAVRNGNTIEYISLDIQNLPDASGSGDVALLTENDKYVIDNAPLVGDPFDITAPFTIEATLNSQGSDLRGFEFNNDGSKLFEAGNGQDIIYQSSLSTQFDITTASFDTSVNAQTSDLYDIAFNNDGSKIYEVGTGKIYQSSLATNFDLDSKSFEKSVNANDGDPTDIAFNDTGTKLYEIGQSSDILTQYSVATPYDIGTLSIENQINTQGSGPYGIDFASDGTRFWESDLSSNKIYQFDLTTPFEISSASLDTSVDARGNDLTSIKWSIDGKQLFESHRNQDEIIQIKTTTGGWETL